MAMLLFPYSDSFYPIGCYRPRRYTFNPFHEIAQMDRMIDSLVGELEKVSESDIGSQVTYNDKGDFALRCDTSGFKPEELTVDLDGQTLTVNGKHVEDNEGQSVERHFSRVIRLPKELDQNQIKCELDDKGELSINIPRREQLEAPKQNVPIEMKKNEN